MSRTVKIQAAKTHLSALLADVERGEEVIIARGDEPVARLVPVRGRGQRDLGFVAWQVPGTFFEELPQEELAAWES
ncbi:MAG TPA: type II toxin-antitoxin system prevent-host-death family antitoxin [Intrasporangium sp.]|uniref:type II toxin-antitoxin system Phd/YefM family antitoxin n=1 Tax=Intrasporangium sp. TaxID=1925024 RepID=UPI002D792DC1|nr:type II toxin-antitoxin system prevent-host-death family antitoxin [Intrasporangium sp.]HET7399734.1 type II toxin-antitoxin system prevent-host-death family antitoxin [Intrasporangium sp.]